MLFRLAPHHHPLVRVQRIPVDRCGNLLEAATGQHPARRMLMYLYANWGSQGFAVVKEKFFNYHEGRAP